MLANRIQRGDTIIEVLLAITIFSMVAVGTLAVMNQGTNAAQRALEITLVRQQIDAQAEALRAAHQVYAASPADDAQWLTIRARAGSYADTTKCPQAPSDVGSSFVMDPRKAEIVGNTWLENVASADAPPYAQLSTVTDPPIAYGLWIQNEKVEKSGFPDAYDFRIRACWYGAGTGSTPQQIETLVRLYDPAS